MADLNIWTHGSPNGRLSSTQRLTGRGLAILAGSVVLAGMLGTTQGAKGSSPFFGTVSLAGMQVGAAVLDSVDAALDSVEVEAPTRELERAQALLEYSARFNLKADLTALIYDIAVSEGIDPELGFRVVYHESRFNPRAVSSAGALGLAQVMPNTARIFDPELSAEDLFDAEVNLRIGFRFLRQLVDQYPDDLPLALLAYNRGPTRLRQLLEGGVDPRNGYASSVLDGYLPTGADELQ